MLEFVQYIFSAEFMGPAFLTLMVRYCVVRYCAKQKIKELYSSINRERALLKTSEQRGDAEWSESILNRIDNLERRIIIQQHRG